MYKHSVSKGLILRVCVYMCVFCPTVQCGFAPIHCAARANHRDCVTLLLQSGACGVNEKTQFGENPFLIACLNGSYDVARFVWI